MSYSRNLPNQFLPFVGIFNEVDVFGVDDQQQAFDIAEEIIGIGFVERFTSEDCKIGLKAPV